MGRVSRGTVSQLHVTIWAANTGLCLPHPEGPLLPLRAQAGFLGTNRGGAKAGL